MSTTIERKRKRDDFARRLASLHSDRRAFTLIELLVVVAIIALLISIMLPALSMAREQAKRAACAAELHMVGIGMSAYAAETRTGMYPPGLQETGVPFGPPVHGNGAGSGVIPEGLLGGINPSAYYAYPAHIALYKLKFVQDGHAFYCPAQEVIKPGQPAGWERNGVIVNNPSTTQHSTPASWQFCIGMNIWANFWMGTYTRNQYKHPDSNYGADGLIDQVSEFASDKNPSRRLMLSDIMQDRRSRREVLKTNGVTGGSPTKPPYSYNSHGGPAYFAGGNIGYGDNSVRWQSRTKCEGQYVADYVGYMVSKTLNPRGSDTATSRTEKMVRYLNMCLTDLRVMSGTPIRPMSFYWAR